MLEYIVGFHSRLKGPKVVFTGLVEEKARVESLIQTGDNFRLRVACSLVHEGAAIGDSISVNGCCLTVVEQADSVLGFDAVPETMLRTNLGQLVEGSPVNLERALRPDTRLGGHYVTGHIDGLGTVKQIDQNEEWWKFYVKVDAALARQMASKGSVAIDGVSLTLVDVTDGGFSVVLIPHTLEVTTIGGRAVGEPVNIETDLLAKYVERQLQFMN